MFKLDNNLLLELGLGGLPAEEKNKMLRDVYSGAEDLIRTGIEKALGRMPLPERSGDLIRDALKEIKKTKDFASERS